MKGLNSPDLVPFGIRICLAGLNLNLPSRISTAVLSYHSSFMRSNLRDLVKGLIVPGLLWIKD